VPSYKSLWEGGNQGLDFGKKGGMSRDDCILAERPSCASGSLIDATHFSNQGEASTYIPGLEAKI